MVCYTANRQKCLMILALRDVLFVVCWLLNNPNNMLVYLRDGAAQTMYVLPH